jgi:hypothetical protein
LLAITGGAVLSMASGFGVAAIPVILWAGAQGIGSLFIPSSPVFRDAIDRRARGERREVERQQLSDRIAEKAANFGDSFPDLVRYGDQYRRLRERVAELRTVVGQPGQISARDWEKLDDATVDFLRLVYARLLIQERLRSDDDRRIQRQLRQVEQELENVSSAADRRRLEVAQSDLERLLERRAALPGRDAANAAQLTTMYESFEELVHRLTTGGGTEGLGEFLRDTTARMEVEEDLSASVDAELDDLATRTRARAGQGRVAN